MDPEAFIPLTNDALFHTFFARHQDLLLRMLEAVLGREIESLTVLNPSLPGDVSVSKVIVLDVLAKLADGSRVNVEIQVRVSAGIKARWVFYGCRNYAQQLLTGEHYLSLRPSVVVVWMVEPLFPDAEAFHSVYELRERRTGRLYSEDLALHVLELSKVGLVEGPNAEGHEELTRQWGELFMATSALELGRIAEQNEVMSEAVRALYETSSDPLVAEFARRREESQFFYELQLSEARGEAERVGLEKGREKGREEGREEGERLVLEKLLRLKFGTLPAVVAQRLESATGDELNLWTERLLGAAALDDVFV